jgi:hypothetical protein
VLELIMTLQRVNKQSVLDAAVSAINHLIAKKIEYLPLILIIKLVFVLDVVALLMTVMDAPLLMIV